MGIVKAAVLPEPDQATKGRIARSAFKVRLEGKKRREKWPKKRLTSFGDTDLITIH
jgi:hypothetical protein